MSKFLNAMDYYKPGDLMHHGVKGMKWGNTERSTYIPKGQRNGGISKSSGTDFDGDTIPIAQPTYEPYPMYNPAPIMNCPAPKVQSTAKKIWGGIGIGLGAAAILGGLGFAGYKMFNSKSVLTKDGAALNKKIEEMKKGGTG